MQNNNNSEQYSNMYEAFFQQQCDANNNPMLFLMPEQMYFQATSNLVPVPPPQPQPGPSDIQIQASELSGYASQGYILPQDVAEIVMRVCRPAEINFENAFDLYHFQKCVEEEDCRFRTILEDRLRGGIAKEGSKMFLSGMKQNVLDNLFGTRLHGKRDWYMRRMGVGNKNEDWRVEVHYTFEESDELIKTLEVKESSTVDMIGAFIQIVRPVYHYYSNLVFRWDAFNGRLYVDWVQ